MAMSKADKRVLKDDFAESFKKASAAIVAEYRGLTVTELTDLRVRLREAKAEFRVIKNRVAKVAIKEGAPNLAAISGSLKGPVGVVLIFGDPAAATKSLLDFEKDKKELFKVTTGVMEGKALSTADLKALADLPSKEVLLARIVGTIASPSRGLVTCIAGVPRQLVTVLAAIRDKKK